MSAAVAATWSAPLAGLSHLLSVDPSRWATVVDHGTWAELNRWYPGCKFRPIESRFDTVEHEHAKRAGEKWLEEQAS